LKDWPGLIALVDKQDWTEAEFYRYALQALAYRSLGKEFPSQAAWRDALRHCAHRLDRFSRLAQVTAGWGWNAENTEVLEKITSEFPKEKWAATSLMAQLYSAGNTRELTDFLKKRYATDPTDILVKNNLANLYLLRKSDLDKAYRLAREAHTMAPKDPFFTSTYAYSLLLQNKTDEAVQAVSELKAEYLQIPSVAAYYGVIQAESGHKELARAALKRADGAKLLPEETELVRVAKAHL
jgi:Flp pilus assembly protein TadD